MPDYGLSSSWLLSRVPTKTIVHGDHMTHSSSLGRLPWREEGDQGTDQARFRKSATHTSETTLVAVQNGRSYNPTRHPAIRRKRNSQVGRLKRVATVTATRAYIGGKEMNWKQKKYQRGPRKRNGCGVLARGTRGMVKVGKDNSESSPMTTCANGVANRLENHVPRLQPLKFLLIEVVAGFVVHTKAGRDSRAEEVYPKQRSMSSPSPDKQVNVMSFVVS
ncbi:hypothetical protein QR685DRAFT_547887 [Neurospora intermedia]|uniref:Uncharacterized protein n=1 Tax=Neurospora intermedia TaxID=5142 RepID=A0ABR3D1W0_NEUIN